ncbi:MAG: hypothetical protein AMS15_04925 [Planctomycetes bacterium DG_23]|nr:MAG: hypothetical protein AMS15_04925 [Planctomycetes bacterium DG_23]
MDGQIKVKDSSNINYWLLVFLGFTFISLFLFPPLTRRRLKVEQEVARLTQEVEALKAKRNLLTKEERALKSDPFYNEVLARRELRMLKPGERVVPVQRPRVYSGKNPLRRQEKAASNPLASFLDSMPFRLGLLAIGLGLIITALLVGLEEKSPTTATTLDR